MTVVGPPEVMPVATAPPEARDRTRRGMGAGTTLAVKGTTGGETGCDP